MTDRRLLTPSIDYLRDCGRYLLDTEGMSRFLQIPQPAIRQMAWTGRIPVPLKIGGQAIRWNVLELLAWVEAGCDQKN